MKKRILAAVLATASILGAVAGCSSNNATSSTGSDASSTTDSSKTEDSKTDDSSTTPKAQGKVLNIYAWNEEFKGFFEKYYAGTTPLNEDDVKKKGADPIYFDKAPGLPEGVTVNWVIKPSDNGVYQDTLDKALKGQSGAKDDDKVDMFLAEADYILKYTNSDYTMDVSTIGVNTLDTQYKYTVDAASDASGKVKGVSFQCCPAAVIYRRSIAKDVLGTDDPEKVQEAISDWTKFDGVAKTAKEKGYYMTGSYVETLRTFSNNATSPWVVDGKLNISDEYQKWTDQAENYLKNGYTLTAGIWEDEKTAQMFKNGKTMCFFGPAWYYNFSMGNAQDPNKGCPGDWAICEGPQAYFWGGTWMLAATGTDNDELVASIMKAFTENEDICTALIKNENQFTNNSKVNETFANDPDYGNAFLGGQNDTAMYVKMAANIKFENKTIYDQLLSEKYPSFMLEYFTGKVATKDEALQNFYKYVNETYPAIVTP